MKFVSAPRRRSTSRRVLLAVFAVVVAVWLCLPAPWVDLETGKVHVPRYSMARAMNAIQAAVFPRSGDRCSLSLAESAGFFCESDDDWLRRKEVFNQQQSKQIAKGLDTKSMDKANFWWQANYEPDFSCRFEERLGRIGDGGKWVCDPSRIAELYQTVQKRCLVYSFGSNNEFSFEKSVVERLPLCEVHTFDHNVVPTKAPEKVIFHRWKLAAKDAGSMKTLSTIMSLLDHGDDYVLEILKMDIEGNEWDALLPQLEANTLPFVRQLLVELHPKDFSRVRRFFLLLKEQGWVITHKEPNILQSGKLVEYVFLNLRWDHGKHASY